MILTSSGKKFIYTSIISMALSMALPWESLNDYSYMESVGLLLNILPAAIFAITACIVIIDPIAKILNKLGTNYIFLLLCLLNAVVLYFGMQYYPDTYTFGYLLFPTSVILFMLGAIHSVRRVNGLQN